MLIVIITQFTENCKIREKREVGIVVLWWRPLPLDSPLPSFSWPLLAHKQPLLLEQKKEFYREGLFYLKCPNIEIFLYSQLNIFI